MEKQTKQKEVIGEAQKELERVSPKKLKHVWEEGWDLGCRSGNWPRHIFREHNTVADRWAQRGSQGEETLGTTGITFGWGDTESEVRVLGR